MRSHAAANRAAILDAGRRVLLRDPHAGMAAVATAAGVSRRTVYGHFAGRDALIAAIAAQAGDELTDRLAVGPGDAAPGDDPVAELADLIARTSRGLTPYYPVGELALRSGAESALRDRALAVRARAIGLIAAAQAAGAVPGELPAEALADLVAAVQRWVFETASSGALDTDAAPRTAARTALQALGVAHRTIQQKTRSL